MAGSAQRHESNCVVCLQGAMSCQVAERHPPFHLILFSLLPHMYQTLTLTVTSHVSFPYFLPLSFPSHFHPYPFLLPLTSLHILTPPHTSLPLYTLTPPHPLSFPPYPHPHLSPLHTHPHPSTPSPSLLPSTIHTLTSHPRSSPT